MQRMLSCALLVSIIALPSLAAADSLYNAGEASITQGRPLRLVGDRKAASPGDLVAINFNFAVTSAASITNAQKKDFAFSGGKGTGIAAIAPLTLATALSGQSNSDSSKTKADTSSFATSMMATVTDVLPNGALEIEGNQRMTIDGKLQTLHVTGMIRPEDIDNSDSISSTKIANVDARFVGDNTTEHHGIITKVLDALF